MSSPKPWSPAIAWLLLPSLLVAGLVVAACTSRTESLSETTSTSSASTTTVPTTTVEASTTSTVPSGPFSYLLYGWDGVTRVEGGVARRLTIEPVGEVVEDGAGGVVFRTLTEEPGLVWLPAGADGPVEVDLGEGGWPSVELAGLIEGRPSVVVNRSWDGMVWCEPEDLLEEVLVLDLETGSERFVMCRAYGPDGGSIWTSYGGGLFSLVDWGAWGGFGTDERIRFLDLSGGEVAMADNPFPEGCAPCELDTRLSPDGRLLAYAYWPTAFWQQSEPPDGDYQRAHDEWWEASKDIPSELVVLDLETGERLWRAEAPAQTRLDGFDGRYLTLNTSTGRTIHDTATGEVYTVPPARTEPTDFWVAILDSLDTATHSYADAQQVAAEIADEYDVETGVLWSEGWVTLNPGYWAVFTGGYATRAEAASTCEELRALVGACYPRYVATPETIDPEIGRGMLELSGDGLGLVDFGTSEYETLDLLSRLLDSQPPDGWVSASWVEYIGWRDLGLFVGFSQPAWSQYDGVPRFVGWDIQQGDGNLPLVTATGVGLGTTVAELRAIYGDQLSLPEQADDCVGWVVSLPDGDALVTLDGPPSDDARVWSILSGVGVGC